MDHSAFLFREPWLKGRFTAKLCLPALALLAHICSAQQAFSDEAERQLPQSKQPQWEGAYVGVHFGGGNGSIQSKSGSNTSSRLFQAGDHDSGGILAGWNLRHGHHIFGVEGVISINELKSNYQANALPGHSSDYVWHSEARLRWGYEVGRFLPFVAGGLVAGEFYQQSAASASGPSGDLNLIFGYTLGAGLDMKLTRGLALRSEYLYQAFPQQSYQLANVPATLRSRFDLHLGRVALLYHFDHTGSIDKPDQHPSSVQDSTLTSSRFSGPSFGLYAGATDGHVWLTGHAKGSMRMQSQAVSTKVGYLHPIGALRLGVEAELDGHVGSNRFNPEGPVSDFRHRLLWSAGLRAKAGWVHGRFMPYVTAGFSLGQFTAQAQPNNNTMLEPYKNGHSFGAGLELATTEQVSLDLGYSYNVYNGTRSNTSGTLTTVRQDFHKVRFGLVLR